MQQKKQNLIQVSLADFSVRALRQAAREGRLFMQMPAVSIQEQQQQCVLEIMQYVSAIEECASAEYGSRVHALWQQIISNPVLQPLLVMRQGRNQGKPNKYRITAIATIMLNCGVYRKDEFTAVDLHLRMEHSKRRNVYYTNMDKYWLNRTEKQVLIQIFKDFSAV